MGSLSEERYRDPVTGGEKGKKPEAFSLLPWDALAEVAKVYNYGAQKYSPHNWEKGYPWSLSLDALYRHVAAFTTREDLDPESGLPHLAHAAFHILALLWFAKHGKGADDRFYDGTKGIGTVQAWYKKVPSTVPASYSGSMGGGGPMEDNLKWPKGLGPIPQADGDASCGCGLGCHVGRTRGKG